MQTGIHMHLFDILIRVAIVNPWNPAGQACPHTISGTSLSEAVIPLSNHIIVSNTRSK